MLRHVHYEAAFESFLRERALPYVPVNEHRKAMFDGARLKSFDFIVYAAADCTWLVEIKGRKFPYDSPDGQKRRWENWVTRDDVTDLTRWQALFGESYAAMLVFAYVLTEAERRPQAPVHAFAGAEYAFYAASVRDYRDACRSRSARWDTLSVPVSKFRRFARPIEQLLPAAPAISGEISQPAHAFTTVPVPV